MHCMFDLQYWASASKTICQTVLLIWWLICWVGFWVCQMVDWLYWRLNQWAVGISQCRIRFSMAALQPHSSMWRTTDQTTVHQIKRQGKSDLPVMLCKLGVVEFSLLLLLVRNGFAFAASLLLFFLSSDTWQLGAVIMIGNILTLLRSSAASSFFWMSSREMSLFGGLVMQWAVSDTGEDGFRMTSKAWPEARLLMGLMSKSARVTINGKQIKKPEVSSEWLSIHTMSHKEGWKRISGQMSTYLRSRPGYFCGSRGTDRSRWVRELKSPSSSLCKL